MPRLHQDGRHRAAALVELGLDDGAFRGAVGARLQLEHLGLEQDGLEQLVEIGALDRRDLDVEDVAAHRFDEDLVLQELGAHALRFGARLVDLVDGNDDRNLGRLGVIDGLDGLRHDAVIGGHHQNHDVGDAGAARAHGGEGGVAGRVDEGDLLTVLLDLVGADVLGDAAGLAGHDIGVADGVEQRCLAVVDMAHDGDHRRARLELRLVGRRGEQTLDDIGFGNAVHGVAHVLCNELGGVGIENVGSLDQLALFHEQLDDIHGTLGHAVGELLDADRLGNRHVARDLLARTVVVDAGAFALAATADGGERAGALGIVERVGNGQLAAAAIVADPAGRLGLGRRTRRLDAAAQRRTFVLLAGAFALGRGGAGRRRCRRLGLGRRLLLVLAEAAAGGLLGATAGLFLGLVTGVFLGLAAGGLGLFLGQALLLRGTAGGGIDGRLALLGLVHLGIGQSAGAGVLLLVGELAQNQAGAIVGALGRRCRSHRTAAAFGLLPRLGRRRCRRGFRLLFARHDDPALLALDLHRIGAAMREALPDGIPFDATLQAKRALRRADRLVVSGFAHTFLSSCTQGSGVFKGVEWPAAGAVRGPVTTKPV